MKLTEGQSQLFPKSQVEQFKYSYDEQDEDYITNELKNKSTTIFEGLYPRQLNLDLAGDITQRTAHPLDLFKEIDDAQKKGYTEILKDKFEFGENIVSEEIFSNKYEELSVIPAVFSLINFLGFVPYKPDTYLNEVYDKSVSEIRSLSKSEKEMNRIRIQLSIHNMLHVGIFCLAQRNTERGQRIAAGENGTAGLQVGQSAQGFQWFKAKQHIGFAVVELG